MESHDNEHHTHSENDQHAREIHAMEQIQAPAWLLPAVLSRLGLEDSDISVYSQAEKQTGQLVRDLSNPDWVVRVAALQTLRPSGSQATIGQILAALHDPDASVRATAAQLLGTLGEQAPLSELMGALNDSSWHVREMAVQALGELGERVPHEPLLLALQDTDASVRKSAALALQQHTPFSMRRVIGNYFQVFHIDRHHMNHTTGGTMQENVAYEHQQRRQRQAGPIKRHSIQRTFALSLALLVVILNIVAWVALTHRLQAPANGSSGHHIHQITTATTGKTLYTYHSNQDMVFDLAWSPDSRRVVEADQGIHEWDATTGAHSVTLSNASSLELAWSPDGTRIASGDIQVQVMDARTGQVLVTYPKNSPQGSSPALTSTNIQNTQSLLSSHTSLSGGNLVTALAWSPDGKFIASALCGLTYGHSVDVWDATTGQKVFSYHSHSDCVYSLAWSPDSKRIASASADHTVQVWDATTGKHVIIYRGHTSMVDGIAWSPDGKFIASAGEDDTLRVWDAATGHTSFIHSLPTSSLVYENFSVAWSPVDARIAVAGGDVNKGFVQLVDATRGTLLYTYTENAWHVRAMAWSPNGKYIASGDDSPVGNDTVKVWMAK